MILVTGGTGHTGRRLVQKLVERGERPRVLTRDPVKLPIDLRRRVEMWRGSLDNPDEANVAFMGASAIIALTHVKYAPRILEQMHATGIRRGIFMSSTRRYTNFPEETARQVIAGEQAIRDSGLDWTIIRASMIYGGPEDNNLEHLVRILRKWPPLVPIPLPAGGRMRWQPVYTWDVVDALIAAHARLSAIQREYTVAGPAPVSLAEMVRTILQGLGKYRPMLSVPLGPVRALVGLAERFQKRPRLRVQQIDRLREDKVFDPTEAIHDLSILPTTFSEGIRRKLGREA